MNQKEIAKETLCILKQGFYEIGETKVDFSSLHIKSVKGSVLIRPEETLSAQAYRPGSPTVSVQDCSTVDAIIRLRKDGTEHVGALNFASAKNPGGGFQNGAVAQEESLACSSGLYPTQCVHQEYYNQNRACKTMCYTDYAIYSPDVVFFRDKDFTLLPEPVTCSVLTLPAVNFGQVLQKREDEERARLVMKQRMSRALQIFAHKGDRVLVLGAYGCGVFRWDPTLVARWWKELIENKFQGCFDRIVYAVYDHSRGKTCINAFRKLEES